MHHSTWQQTFKYNDSNLSAVVCRQLNLLILCSWSLPASELLVWSIVDKIFYVRRTMFLFGYGCRAQIIMGSMVFFSVRTIFCVSLFLNTHSDHTVLTAVLKPRFLSLGNKTTTLVFMYNTDRISHNLLKCIVGVFHLYSVLLVLP